MSLVQAKGKIQAMIVTTKKQDYIIKAVKRRWYHRFFETDEKEVRGIKIGTVTADLILDKKGNLNYHFSASVDAGKAVINE